MGRKAREEGAYVGAADHCGWAVLVTVAGGELLDRRRVELVDATLPSLPHHHEAQGLPLSEAIALIERVRRSAEEHATRAVAALDAEVSVPIVGVALRRCPPLPDDLAERLSNYRAQNVADSVMYRQVLARAAEARRWSVGWYDVKSVFARATTALEGTNVDAFLAAVGQRLGPPWQKDHRTAMAAALAAGAGAL